MSEIILPTPTPQEIVFGIPEGTPFYNYIDLQGQSLYQKWLEYGFTGTELDFLTWLQNDISTKLDKGTYTGNAGLLAARITELEEAAANTPLFSKITLPNGFSISGQTLTINAAWEWLLSNIFYTNVAAVVFPDIPLCSEGNRRFVYFVPNASNTFEMISGTEGVIPVAPPLPNEGIYATYLLITDTLIETPANPNPNNTPSLNAVTTISGESFNPISVLEYGNSGATLYKNIFSIWRYIGAVSKFINIKWDDLTTTYDIRFPAKTGGSTQTFAMVSDLAQGYDTISSSRSLTDADHGKTIWVTATCNITIPSGLRSDFNCTFRTLTGATATFLTSGTTINAESDGDVQAPKTMSYLAVYSTNNYIISGGGLS